MAVSDDQNQLETLDCHPFACFDAKCQPLNDAQRNAYLGFGPFSMPCEAECDAAMAAGCSDSAAFASACVAHCSSAEASAGSCTASLTALWQCLAVNGAYACTQNNAHQLSRSDAIPDLCTDLASQCVQCLGPTACAPFFGEWMKPKH